MSFNLLQSSCQSSCSTSLVSEGNTTQIYSDHLSTGQPRGTDEKLAHNSLSKSQCLQCKVPELKHILPSPTDSRPISDEVNWNQKTLQDSPAAAEDLTSNRKRKHSSKAESSPQDRPVKKCVLQISSDSCVIKHITEANNEFEGSPQQDVSLKESVWSSPDSCIVQNNEATRHNNVENESSHREQYLKKVTQATSESCVIANNKGNLIYHWIQQGSWPKDYFTQGHRNWKSLEYPLYRPKKIESLSHEQKRNARQTRKFNSMAQPSLMRKKSSSSIRCKGLEFSTCASDKSAAYENPSYVALLNEKGSFLTESSQGITPDCEKICQTLLDTPQVTPTDTLFRDDLFKETCRKLEDRNETRVISDIARLIAPSAETLTTYGMIKLQHLIVQMNERWNECISITAKLPQPDYSVGFCRSAFNENQLKKLTLFTGNVFGASKYSSFVLATWQVYFPFFTCETKCGAGRIDVAHRQNAHNMTVALTGVVKLYKYVNRVTELHRKILGFSISHNDQIVLIYGHYPMINDQGTTFYRHLIKRFDLISEDGKDRWTAYQFVMNIYEIFMPDHLKVICSAIDDIPDNIHVETPSEESGARTSSIAASESTGNKRPRLSAAAVLSKDVDLLREQNSQLLAKLDGEREQNRRETDGLREQIKELMDLLKQKL